MKKICTNFIKRNLYKKIPKSLRSQLMKHLLPSIKLDLDNIKFESAKTHDDYIRAFRLLHDVYVESGYAEASAVALRFTPHHFHPDSRIFLGTYNEGSKESLIYTISIFPDSRDGLPMDIAFKNELDQLRSKGRFIAEAGCLASFPMFRKNDMNIPMLGNKILLQYAFQHLDADDLVIAIHPKFQWIYEDLILFEPISEIKQYAPVKNNPAIAMRLDLRSMEANHKKRFGSMPIHKNLHHFFFEGESKSIVLPEKQSFMETNFLNDMVLNDMVLNSVKSDFWGSSSSLSI